MFLKYKKRQNNEVNDGGIGNRALHYRSEIAKHNALSCYIYTILAHFGVLDAIVS